MWHHVLYHVSYPYQVCVIIKCDAMYVHVCECMRTMYIVSCMRTMYIVSCMCFLYVVSCMCFLYVVSCIMYHVCIPYNMYHIFVVLWMWYPVCVQLSFSLCCHDNFIGSITMAQTSVTVSFIYIYMRSWLNADIACLLLDCNSN